MAEKVEEEEQYRGKLSELPPSRRLRRVWIASVLLAFLLCATTTVLLSAPSLPTTLLISPSLSWSWPWRGTHDDGTVAPQLSLKPTPTSSWVPPGSIALEHENQPSYLVGVGKADITGPIVEINLMGYADVQQIGTGLRQRIYSRAFIIADVHNPQDRVVYLVLDTQSGDTAIRHGILERLRQLGPAYAVYGKDNVAVTGTHSHAGPGGWLNYLLPQITSKGFDRQGYEAIVEGVVLSIQRAHESLQPGYLSVASNKVFGANINRSLFAYLANPADERAKYNVSVEDDGSVEKDMTLLKIRRASDNKNLGVLTWFPTHGTSLYGNNTLIAGDNKGVAAYLFEQSMRRDATAADGFVAAFSQANVGDTSPNVLGAWCEDSSGDMCNLENSTCADGRSQSCHGRGPAFTHDTIGAASCYEIGRRQYEPARRLYDQLNVADRPLCGRPVVRSFHTFHDMSGFSFALPNGTLAQTCPAALGYSFAAGTSDGPGAFDFTQHDGNPSTTSPIWRIVSSLLGAPTDEQQVCHGAKPILLDVGTMSKPYAWTPNIVDIQAFRVGPLVIIVSPGEATTMAGRRWKEAVQRDMTRILRQEAASQGGSHNAEEPAPEAIVVLGGPANTYTHYISTEEEYAIQRYEGASTLYGPHTLNAYINVTRGLLPWLATAALAPPSRPALGPRPPINTNQSLSFITPVVRDAPPLLRSFGDVLTDAIGVYRRGAAVRAVFVGANPRNNLRLGGTFAAAEKLTLVRRSEGDKEDIDSSGGIPNIPDIPDLPGVPNHHPTWMRVRDDADWSLVLHWRRTSELLATSEVEIVWETEDWAEPGVYRLRYYGDAKSLNGNIEAFEGTSGPFTLV